MSVTTTRPQPKGLYVLFLTELWERYGFYTTVFLLVLFLTQKVGLADDQADLVFGSFTSLIYAATIFLADRLLGYRSAILFGAVTMASGYVLLFVADETLLYPGLALLVVGNGFFKPNVSSLLGLQYGENDPRRESGFILFYMGINTGGFVAAFASGFIATSLGYQWAFLLAGIAKCLAFATLYIGQRYLENRGEPPTGRPLRMHGPAGVPLLFYFAAGTLLAIVAVWFFLTHHLATGTFLTVLGVVAAGVFLVAVRRQAPQDRQPIIALLLLFCFAIIFFAVYAQAGASVVLFIERNIDRVVMGWTIPPSSFESLNPLFIILTAPFFSWLWIRLARSHADPPVAIKFVLGLLFIGAAFLVLRLSATLAPDALASPGWIVAFFLLYTCGEMCISPVGLSMVSQLAPARLLGFAMGTWFFVQGFSNYLGGLLAQIAAVPKGTSKSAAEAIYGNAFSDYALIAMAAALVLLALTPLVNRLVRPSVRGAP